MIDVDALMELLPMKEWDGLADEEKLQYLHNAAPAAMAAGKLDLEVFEGMRKAKSDRVDEDGNYVPAHVEHGRNMTFIATIMEDLKSAPDHHGVIVDGKRIVVVSKKPVAVMIECTVDMVIKNIIITADETGQVFASYKKSKADFAYDLSTLSFDFMPVEDEYDDDVY